LVSHGRGLAITIRSVARGKIGYRNEKLVLFKVAPVRSRKQPPVEPKPPVEVRQLAAAPGASQAPAAEAEKPDS